MSTINLKSELDKTSKNNLEISHLSFLHQILTTKTDNSLKIKKSSLTNDDGLTILYNNPSSQMDHNEVNNCVKIEFICNFFCR